MKPFSPISNVLTGCHTGSCRSQLHHAPELFSVMTRGVTMLLIGCPCRACVKLSLTYCMPCTAGANPLTPQECDTLQQQPLLHTPHQHSATATEPCLVCPPSPAAPPGAPEAVLIIHHLHLTARAKRSSSSSTTLKPWTPLADACCCCCFCCRALAAAP